MDNNFMGSSNPENGSGNNGSGSSPRSDYSAPEQSYNPDVQYGFSSEKSPQDAPYGAGTDTAGSTNDYYGGQPQGGYNLNGQYYSNSSESYGAGTRNAAGGGYQYGSSYNGGNGSGNFNNGNYNNGMNFGQPPLDKKGRPVPNNFGMKLTFGILEIVVSLYMTLQGSWCVGIVPLVLSVIATVYVCLQNSEYKAQHWDSFVSRRKVSNVLLWVSFGIMAAFILLVIILAILLVAGVLSFSDYLNRSGLDLDKLNDIYENRSDYDGLQDDMDDLLDDIDDQLDQFEDGNSDDYDYDNDDYDDDYDDDGHDHDSSHAGSADIEDMHGANVPDVDGFEKFALGGEKISLPVSCKDFRAAGFTIGKEADDEKLDPGESSGYAYYDAEGEMRGTVFIYNTKDKKIKAKDGVIGGITISDAGKDDLEMVGGLNFDSTVDDCVEVLGAKVTSEYVGNTYNSYSWWFEKGGYFTSMQFQFSEDGEAYEVWIVNTEDLM